MVSYTRRREYSGNASGVKMDIEFLPMAAFTMNAVLAALAVHSRMYALAT